MNKFLIAVIAIMSVTLGLAITRLNAIEEEVHTLREQAVLQIDALGKQVHWQTGAINNGLKNLAPLVLPPDIEGEISNIEAQLKNEATWPKTLPEIQRATHSEVPPKNSLPSVT